MPKILIADDTHVNVQILGRLLQKDYEVFVASNGSKAVQIATEKHPDIILMDVMMPELDGYAACAQLKQQAETGDIPVIFITAKTASEDIVRGFACGGVDYVVKPFNPPEVLARVKTHVELKQMREELKKTVAHLTQALAKVKLLTGLLPICSYCKKIRNDTGYWQRVELYIADHTDATFTHGVCPECLEKMMQEIKLDPDVPSQA